MNSNSGACVPQLDRYPDPEQRIAALTAELRESFEQQAATTEVLRTISSSPNSAQPVFDMIARCAKQLCDGQFCAVFRFDGALIHLVSHHGISAEGAIAYERGFPVPPSRVNAISRAIEGSCVAHIPDVEADPGYGSLSVARAVTFRSIVAVPMMHDGQPIGGIAVSRSVVGLFPAKHIAQLHTFANQAVIAIENVRLFNQTKESLEQQSAMSEILRVISGSTNDIQPVMNAVSENAARVCGARDAQIFRIEGELLRLAASFGSLPALEGFEQGIAINRNWVTGRAVVDRQTVHIHDLSTAPVTEFPKGKEFALRFGHRTTLATPLLREGIPIGAILIRRSEVRPFSDKQVTLLETFATQAVIAIENVRLFKALESRTEALTLSNEQLAAVHAQVTALNAQLQSENLRMVSELEVTRRLQLMLLPGAAELQGVEGLDIAGHMQPAVEVGGDYFDVLQHEGRVKIGIGDVTGHGLESGVLMVMTQAIVRALLTSGETDHVRFLSTLNLALFGNVQRMGGDKNLTLCLLDYAAGEVKVSGQHEVMIVVRKGGTVERVDTIDLGFPVGLVDDISAFVGQVTVRLEPGDGIVLYTDGITEAENMGGEQYGLARLCAVVSRHWSESAEAIKEAVVADVAAYIGAQTVYDDITLVVLKQQ